MPNNAPGLYGRHNALTKEWNTVHAAFRISSAPGLRAAFRSLFFVLAFQAPRLFPDCHSAFQASTPLLAHMRLDRGESMKNKRPSPMDVRTVRAQKAGRTLFDIALSTESGIENSL